MRLSLALPPLVLLVWAASPFGEGAARAGDSSTPADGGGASIEPLRRDVERAYLEAQKDHARVRAADFADVVKSAPLEQIVGGTGPLSATSMRVLTARLRAEEGAPEDRLGERFLEAARHVFRHERFEDCWDESFLELPAVQAFRAAHDAASKTARPTPAADDPYADMVFLDRGHPMVGPWTGWVSPIPEKDNRRQRRQIKPFAIDRHEVTCGEYLEFLRRVDPERRRALLPAGWKIGDDGAPEAAPGPERRPVSGVTYAQAAAYAEALGKRLPTEDEWERAAAGGDAEPRTYPWGAEPAGKRWAYAPAGLAGPGPVDAYPDDVTPEGVLGLAGNVAEIVATLPDRKDVPRAGPEKGTQVVVRGGHYRSRESECATSWRWVVDGHGSADTVGFRCAMDEADWRKRLK